MSNNDKDYKPISCGFYDGLLLLATRKKNVEIQYLQAEETLTIHAVIIDVFTKQKEEFLKLDNGLEIRLDKLISVDNQALQYTC